MNDPNLSSFAGLPALLTAEQGMPPLGLRPEHAPILVRRNLLCPVGHPGPNSVKRFMRDELDRLSHDRKWLAKAHDALSGEWRMRNAKARAREPESSTQTQTS
jgi:hypothetical protein